MLNFDFKRGSQKCSQTERPFQPGEEFWSALVDRDGETIRLDFCLEAWSPPIDNCIGCWKSKVPELDKGRIYWAPPDILLEYFEHLVGQPSQTDTAYVMGLLLVQKKILQLDDSHDPTDTMHLDLIHRKTKQTYRLDVPDIAPHRVAEIQNELAERLFTHEPPDTHHGEPDSP